MERCGDPSIHVGPSYRSYHYGPTSRKRPMLVAISYPFSDGFAAPGEFATSRSIFGWFAYCNVECCAPACLEQLCSVNVYKYKILKSETFILKKKAKLSYSKEINKPAVRVTKTAPRKVSTVEADICEELTRKMSPSQLITPHICLFIYELAHFTYLLRPILYEFAVSSSNNVYNRQ